MHPKKATRLPVTLLFAGFAYLCTLHPVAAQITISADQFTAQTGTSFNEYLADKNAGTLPADLTGLEALLKLDGNGSDFDFAGITAQLALFARNQYLPLPSDSVDVPGYATFFEGKATDVWRVQRVDGSAPDVFVFRKITSDSLAWLGNGVWQDTDNDGTADPVVSVFAPAKLQARLPMQVGDAWTADHTHMSVVNTPIGVIEVPGIVEEHDIKIDGYGTLITHQGVHACLRVRINQVIHSPDGSSQEIGGWSFITPDLVQLGVFYDALIPDDLTQAAFDFSEPQSISLFSPAEEGGMSTASEQLPRHPAGQLGQNFPNPFQTATNIPFTLQRPGMVTIRVYNILGQLVDKPVESVFPAGKHQVNWQAAEMPAGIYIYQAEIDGKVSQRQLTRIP